LRLGVFGGRGFADGGVGFSGGEFGIDGDEGGGGVYCVQPSVIALSVMAARVGPIAFIFLAARRIEGSDLRNLGLLSLDLLHIDAILLRSRLRLLIRLLMKFMVQSILLVTHGVLRLLTSKI
jgi:hypothetical protein